MQFNLDEWQRDWSMMGLYFTSKETELIQTRLKEITIDYVFICSFESRFAKSGGLAAVIVNILPYLKEINQIKEVSLISPFYPHIMASAPLKPTGKNFRIFFDNRFIDAEILLHESPYEKPAAGRIFEYYIKADGFFTAKNTLNDPYFYIPDNPTINDEAIRYNSTFFCKAVPAAVAALGINKNILLHAQEWQTALLALTAKEAMVDETLHSCAVVQTIHNPFDSHLPAETLKKMVSEPRKVRIDHMLSQGATAYQISLPLMDAPISTVSKHFAQEFTSDPLQTEHFAPHLQGIFLKDKVYGINNGPFIDFSPEFPKRGKHTLREIESIKRKKRAELMTMLDAYWPDERFGVLDYQGKSIKNMPIEIPIIVMSGRLDSVQKGYDILLRALERFGKDDIKAILAPMPVHSSDLDYFHEVTSKCRGNVTVFPIRMRQGYQALQCGCTFGIMPSIYEPFGAAIEYMVNGTVVIARATGGLMDQVENEKNGFLFIEDQRHYNLQHIRDFVTASDMVQMRKKNLWAQDMAESLFQALTKAKDFYQKNPKGYYEMVRHGFAKAETFGWDTTAALYGMIYGKVNHG